MVFQVNHVIIVCALFVCYNLPINGKAFQANKQTMEATLVKHMDEVDNSNLQNSNEQLFPTISRTQCECAIFGDEEVFEKNKPIISHSPTTISCNEDGKTNCNKLCIALAEAAKDKGPDILCSIIGHRHNELKVSIYSRICNEENWTYTGFTCTKGICCHEYKFVPCEILKELLNDNNKENKK